MNVWVWVYVKDSDKEIWDEFPLFVLVIAKYSNTKAAPAAEKRNTAPAPKATQIAPAMVLAASSAMLVMPE